MNSTTLDPVWEQDIYAQGHHLNRYPFDCVVSFLFRWHPRDKARAELSVVEVGCGAGNNLWFAAREGFAVAGVDSSASAIAHARRRFGDEGLMGDFRVGVFSQLPWSDGSADIVIDRCSLACVGHESQRVAVAEIWRVLKPGGVFFCNGYSDRHASARAGRSLGDGRTADFAAGALAGVGAICFSSREDLRRLFGASWEILKLEHMSADDLTGEISTCHAEWRVVVRKPA
ncbi:MAG: class I SAM-dependent methyltransferase [Opitutaceae bacterium]